MYIVDQDRSNVVNIGNIKSIALNGKRITADDYTLAAYDTEQRGKEVFEQLLGNAFPPDMIVAKNCNISEDAVKDLAMDHSIIMVSGNGQAEFIICRRNKRMVDVILAIIWIAILVLYIVVGWKDAKSNNEVKKEITQMNELLLEQNSQLKEQNKHLNMVILSVCSKSVRDRKNAEGGKDAQTETGGKQTTLEKETGTENETTAADRRTSVSSEV